MVDYSDVYENLANRAIKQSIIDIESFVSQLLSAGVSEQRINEMLLEDFDSGGPIFGKLKRSLTGAVTSSSMAAIRQGEAVGYLANTAPGKSLAKLAKIQGSVIDAIDNADHAALRSAGRPWSAPQRRSSTRPRRSRLI